MLAATRSGEPEDSEFRLGIDATTARLNTQLRFEQFDGDRYATLDPLPILQQEVLMDHLRGAGLPTHVKQDESAQLAQTTSTALVQSRWTRAPVRPAGR